MAAATKTEEIIEPRRVTVGFERSVSVRPYETEKASIFVQVDVGPNDTTEQILEAVHAEYVGAKSEVYHQLGIKFEVTQEGVVKELLERELGAIPLTAVQNIPTAPSAAPSGGFTDKKAKTEAAWADVAANPKGWFDNRATAAGTKRPAFKGKNTNKTFGAGDGTALWLPAPDGVTLPDASSF